MSVEPVERWCDASRTSPDCGESIRRLLCTTTLSERSHRPFALLEAAAFGVTDVTCQLDRLGKVHAHHAWRMGV